MQSQLISNLITGMISCHITVPHNTHSRGGDVPQGRILQSFLSFCLPHSSLSTWPRSCPLKSYPFSLPYSDLTVPEKFTLKILLIHSFNIYYFILYTKHCAVKLGKVIVRTINMFLLVERERTCKPS